MTAIQMMRKDGVPVLIFINAIVAIWNDEGDWIIETSDDANRRFPGTDHNDETIQRLLMEVL
jgi:hypothetical protein